MVNTRIASHVGDRPAGLGDLLYRAFTVGSTRGAVPVLPAGPFPGEEHLLMGDHMERT